MSVALRHELPLSSSRCLRAITERRFAESIDVPTRFFEVHAGAVADVCLAMARRFHRGGRLLVFGLGAEATDAQHVAVEFVHPVLVGKRALPAIALTNDVAALTGLSRDGSVAEVFAGAIEALGRKCDIALGIARDGGSEAVVHGLRRARELEMLTVALVGGGGAAVMDAAADFIFAVPSADPLLVQEVHETLYHVIWELVHVFFEHGTVG